MLMRPISVCIVMLWGVYTIQQTSSKLPANVFKIHVLMLDVCWMFAGSCKHPINYLYSRKEMMMATYVCFSVHLQFYREIYG